MSDRPSTQGWRAGLGERVAKTFGYGVGVAITATVLKEPDVARITLAFMIAYTTGWNSGREWLRSALWKIRDGGKDSE